MAPVSLRDESGHGVLLAAPGPHGENPIVIGCSAGAGRLLGASAPDLLGQPLDALFSDAALGHAVARAAARGQHAELEGAASRGNSSGGGHVNVLVATEGLCSTHVASIVALVENDEEAQEGGEGATRRDAGRGAFGEVKSLLRSAPDGAPDPSLLNRIDESWLQNGAPAHYRALAERAGKSVGECLGQCLCSPCPDYPILYASQRFVALFGHPLSGLLGKNPRVLQDSAAPRQGISRAAAALSACRSFACVVANCTRRGDPVRNLLTVQPLLRRGVPVVFVGWQMEIAGCEELLPPELLAGECFVENAVGTPVHVEIQSRPRAPPPLAPPPAPAPAAEAAGAPRPEELHASPTAAESGGRSARPSALLSPGGNKKRGGAATERERSSTGDDTTEVPRQKTNMSSAEYECGLDIRGLKQQALATVELTELEVQQYARMFRTFDVDGSGTIDTEELRDVMKCLGVRVTDKELLELQQTVDSNGSGEIEFDEFLVLMKQYKDSCRFKVLNKNQFAAEHIQNATKSSKVLPDARWKWVWDSMIILITLYYVLVVFYEDARSYPMFRLRMIGESFVSLFLFLDILLSFNIARPHPRRTSTLVESTMDLVRMYVYSPAFRLDICAAIPLDLALRGAGYDTAAQYCRHLRLLRLFRVQSLYQILPRGTMPPLYVRFHFHYVPLIKAGFWWVTMVHILACIRLLITSASRKLKALPGAPDGAPLALEPEEDYVTAIYWVLYTLTTVGYGDIPVDSDSEKLFACLLFIVGLVVNGVMIGKLTVIIQKGDVDSERKERMRETLAVIEHFDVPEVLQDEILAFQYHVLANSLSTSYSEVIVGLPQNLKDNLGMYMRIKFISAVGLFADAQEECKVALAQSLQNLLTAPEELVFVAGDPAEEMFFMAHGFADMIDMSGRYMGTVKKGSNFGEEALITQTPRTYSVKSLTYCELFVLVHGDFIDILKRFPAFRAAVAHEMGKRDQEWKEERQQHRASVHSGSDPMEGSKRTASVSGHHPHLPGNVTLTNAIDQAVGRAEEEEAAAKYYPGPAEGNYGLATMQSFIRPQPAASFRISPPAPLPPEQRRPPPGRSAVRKSFGEWTAATAAAESSSSDETAGTQPTEGRPAPTAAWDAERGPRGGRARRGGPGRARRRNQFPARAKRASLRSMAAEIRALREGMQRFAGTSREMQHALLGRMDALEEAVHPEGSGGALHRDSASTVPSVTVRRQSVAQRVGATLTAPLGRTQDRRLSAAFPTRSTEREQARTCNFEMPQPPTSSPRNAAGKPDIGGFFKRGSKLTQRRDLPELAVPAAGSSGPADEPFVMVPQPLR
eukprot:TRINITY_DN24377_c0_g1_i3.p1 TRINITY_DN24377_c0_g1~~TRINITY_DN24377_c0_g1_i3.p1  ORF type:complete len:1321 (+),score=427.93 TRINITY_DN24377_c0_g1_i3:70-4032(+)